jgi:pimeloyl-ACP methyl ester carboxylesterase
MLLAAPAHGALAAPAQPLPQRSCHLPGVEDALRCVTVPVPLDYADPQAGTLALHVTVAPAYRQAARPDPLIVLAGGPGEAGSDVLPLLSTAFKRVRATRDIVFIDQRGTGLSGKLDCDDNTTARETLSDAQQETAARECIARSKTRFSAYTTGAAAQDIEAVRRSLGYGQINLMGGSYGTRLAQAYARAFPSGVRSLVLDGVAAPDQVIPAAGRDGQAALDKLFDKCERDAACHKAFPNLKAEFATLARRVEGGIKLSLPDPRTAEPVQVEMNAVRFYSTIHRMLYAPGDARRLPFLVHSAWQGRWEPFIARVNLATDFASEGSIAMLLHLAVVCAEDVPRLTPALLAEDSALTRPMTERIPALCPAMKVSAVPYKAPTVIEAPALLLSGALDPVTPPHRAESAARHMPNAQRFVVANAGHGISQLGCAPRLVREFLDRPHAKLDAKCLAEIPAPTFQLGSAGPQP